MTKLQRRIGIFALLAIAAATSLSVFATTEMADAQTDPDPIADPVPVPIVDSMQEITNQIVSNLSNANTAVVQQENINQAKHLMFGKPVILDTMGNADTLRISDNYDTMVNNIKVALLSCAQGTCTDDNVAASAKNVVDELIIWQEVKGNLERYTSNCDATNPTACTILDQGDEPTADGLGITIGDDKIWDGWYREIRSPYFPVYPHPYGLVHEENIIVPPGPLSDGECSAVIKEIQGIKSILRPVVIPIWQEPWTSRAQIIAYHTVWVVDFVPAEFVKTLEICNSMGTLSTTYEIDVIIERQLLHFWKFLPGGFQPGGAVPPGLR